MQYISPLEIKLFNSVHNEETRRPVCHSSGEANPNAGTQKTKVSFLSHHKVQGKHEQTSTDNVL